MTKTNATTATKTRAAKAATKPAKAVAAKPAAKAEPSKLDKDVIVQSSGTAGASGHLIKSAGGETFTFPTAQWSGKVRDACNIGQSFKAAKAAIQALPKGKAQMARGIVAGDAKHSAKAIADQNRGAKATNKADAATQKAKPAAAKKEARKAEAAKSTGDRAYKWIGENAAREGTWRHAMLHCLSQNSSKEAATKCMLKNREFSSHKIDFRWAAAQSYIKWAD